MSAREPKPEPLEFVDDFDSDVGLDELSQQESTVNLEVGGVNPPGSVDATQEDGEDAIQESRKRTILSREAYDAYVAEITTKREVLEDPNASTEVLADTIAQLDKLYSSFVNRTANTRIIEADQHAFRRTAEAILERMKNKSRGVPGELTPEVFIKKLAESANSPGAMRLDVMGAYFLRHSRMVTLPPPAPSLDTAARRQAAPRRVINSKPTEEVKTAAEVDEEEFSVEKMQNAIQQNIVQYVIEDENANNYDPISLYELCYNCHSFVLTLENFFFVSVLVKEQRLWLGADEHGMPVVGSVVNRAKYLETHSNDVCGPRFDLTDNAPKERYQFNWNFNQELYSVLQEVYEKEDPLIPRELYS